MKRSAGLWTRGGGTPASELSARGAGRGVLLFEHVRLEAVEQRQRRLAHVRLGVGERGDRGGGVGLHRRR